MRTRYEFTVCVNHMLAMPDPAAPVYHKMKASTLNAMAKDLVVKWTDAKGGKSCLQGDMGHVQQ